MKKQVFEKAYHVDLSRLKFQEHFSKRAETAPIGPYTVYHFFCDDDYCLVFNKNVIYDTVDLSDLII